MSTTPVTGSPVGGLREQAHIRPVPFSGHDSVPIPIGLLRPAVRGTISWEADWYTPDDANPVSSHLRIELQQVTEFTSTTQLGSPTLHSVAGAHFANPGATAGTASVDYEIDLLPFLSQALRPRTFTVTVTTLGFTEPDAALTTLAGESDFPEFSLDGIPWPFTLDLRIVRTSVPR